MGDMNKGEEGAAYDHWFDRIAEFIRRMGIQSDLHTLVARPHCFQRTAAPGTGSYTWLGRIWEFMNHKGFNK